MSELSIIILQYNTPNQVTEGLNSLKTARLPEDTEIIVVNNGGNEANSKISKDSYAGLNVKFFDIPNLGYPQGNNFGALKASGDYLAFVNPDIVVQPDTIEKLLNYLKQNPKVGIVAPQLRYPDNSVQDNFRVFPRFIDHFIKRIGFLRTRFPERMRRYLMWDKEPDINEAVDWVTGAFIIMRRDCFEAVKKHDEYYFLFMSDVVICREAWKKDFEVHYVGQAQALHNDERLSSGGIFDFFRKKTLRIHLLDTIKYYKQYLFENLPALSPSLKYIKTKDRLLKSSPLKSTLLQVGKPLQKQNPIVTVYVGDIVGQHHYSQPIIFFNTGVIGVIQKQSGEFGLIKIWRHTPLSFNKKNTFPIFPDTGNLGIWSYECPRGGLEKTDLSPEAGLKRELKEEIGLEEKDIINLKPLNRIIGNSAIDVYSHLAFLVTIKNDFQFKTEEKVETIRQLNFFKAEELHNLIKNQELCCGLTQAALLQVISNR